MRETAARPRRDHETPSQPASRDSRSVAQRAESAVGLSPGLMSTIEGLSVGVNDDPRLEAEADVMGRRALQSRATDGGRDVRHRDVSGPPTVQRMVAHKLPTIRGAGIKSNTRTGTQSINIGRGNYDVDVHKLTVEDKDARVDVLKEMSKKVGQVSAAVKGVSVAEWQAARNYGGQHSTTTFLSWTTQPGNCDNDNRQSIDPFILTLTGKHTEETGVDDDDRTLEIDLQMANTLDGYITRIQDGDREAEITEENTNPQGMGMVEVFSKVHDTARPDTMASLLGDAAHQGTSRKSEAAWDAVTKIVGEGARFDCVRKHASNLRNSSRFFTYCPRDKHKVRFVDFYSLWRSWKATFSKKYGVSNKTVWKALEKDKIKITTGRGEQDEWVRTISAERLVVNDFFLEYDRPANADDRTLLHRVQIKGKRENGGTVDNSGNNVTNDLLGQNPGLVLYANKKKYKRDKKKKKFFTLDIFLPKDNNGALVTVDGLNLTVTKSYGHYPKTPVLDEEV